jgi:hypothetical protein
MKNIGTNQPSEAYAQKKNMPYKAIHVNLLVGSAVVMPEV